ncbi:MAG: histone deacetylase [Deltaproteobacteria bacterium]|nr:histone deacetylase [Deltaproteobacteria bacterium]
MTMTERGDDRVLVVDDASFDDHEDIRPHPECPERLTAARSGLEGAVPAGQRIDVPTRWATTAELSRVHTADYLARLDQALGRPNVRIDADTYVSAGSREAVFRAAGGAISLVDELLARRGTSGVALVRPPGHHATDRAAMGFCLVNHVAVAAAAALAGGAERVAIIDWDVHHGNGTEAIFAEDPRVLFVSLHQFPFYPGTGPADYVGRGAGRGTTVNIALPAGTDSAAYGYAWTTVVEPIVRRFAPSLVIVSAGFDAHQRDPLGGLELETATFGALTTAVRALELPSAYFLEGGYDLRALEESVGAMGRALVGEAVALPEDAPSQAARDAVDRTHSVHEAILASA